MKKFMDWIKSASIILAGVIVLLGSASVWIIRALFIPVVVVLLLAKYVGWI